MRVFKSEFKDRESGNMCQTEKWYIDFQDHRRIRRRIPTDRCRTRRDAERFGAMVEQLVIAASHSERPDAKVDAWLRSLSKATLGRFVKFGLIDGKYTTEAVSLTKHLADFEAYLRNTKARHGFARSSTYIHNTVTQVRCIIDKCGFHFWPDITRVAVETCLGKLDVASKTFNAYQASIKLFSEWMVENGRADISPDQRIAPSFGHPSLATVIGLDRSASGCAAVNPNPETRRGIRRIEQRAFLLNDDEKIALEVDRACQVVSNPYAIRQRFGYLANRYGRPDRYSAFILGHPHVGTIRRVAVVEKHHRHSREVKGARWGEPNGKQRVLAEIYVEQLAVVVGDCLRRRRLLAKNTHRET